jgi:precorrin-2/cobalt-factor-2 C20-methyltransferase
MSKAAAATGKLWGLGIGPGDPDLITVKALRILQAADLVAYPAPETGDSLARRIVEPHLRPGQGEYVIRMPIVTERFPAQAVYDRAAADLAKRVTAGDTVAVLCEGDPFFYGSFMYLFGRMAEQVPVEVVPGVSSLTASAAMLSAPLASRNDVLTVLPAPLAADELARRLGDTDAAAIVKIGRHFPKVREVLAQLNLLKEARYVERATMTEERILSLDAVPLGSVPYFSMILVHRRGVAWR